MVSYQWLKECVRYIHRSLLPRRVWSHWAEDDRKGPEIAAGTVWLTVLCGFMMQIPSFEQLGRTARDGFGKLLPRGQRPPSVDTMRDGMTGIDLDQLKRLFVYTMKRVKAMKAVGWIEGLRVAAIDGTHTFASTIFKCEDCRKREHGNGNITYDHLGVFCHSVGGAPRLFWGYEPVHPGEGETTAAKRLVDWLYTHFKHFVDVMALDAGFAGAPFLKALQAKGYHYVVRLKDERTVIVNDAIGLFRRRVPDERFTAKGSRGQKIEVRIWEEHGLTSWEAMSEGVRVVYVEEEDLNGRESGKVQKILVATDLTSGQASARAIRAIIHARWIIENTGFHEAKGKWRLDHCFVHTARAIQALHWFQMLAINLMRMYLQRHSKFFTTSRLTMGEVARRMEGEVLYAQGATYHMQTGWDTS